ncbi:MAG: glucose-6-phosphate isomerase [Gammaproteobacteria bacterium]
MQHAGPTPSHAPALRDLQAAGLLVDFTKQSVPHSVLGLLLELARDTRFSEARSALFDGDRINRTEDRAVLHTALRTPPDRAHPDVADAVRNTQDRIRSLARAVRTGNHRGYTGKAVRDVVHIGIGGSHLGPELVVEALNTRASPLRCHFVANVDGHALTRALANCQPETTLFVIVSKSFGTLETQVNANSARQWFLERTGDTTALARHFIAVSANVPAAREFGIGDDQIYPLWDWVGGRFSLWSAVGLPILFSAGPDAFDELLNGAHAMDEHFRNAPAETNLPLLMALVGLWNFSFRGAESLAILPYDQRLRLLPNYLQQLEMESNGKSVHIDGTPVGIRTMPVVWGGEGTNGQHAFHQLLHQGTQPFTADFILVARAGHPLHEHQRWLHANALAQSQAMLLGHNDGDPHRRVPGQKPTTTIVLDALTPARLGALLALYEHKVFCHGILWQINSFDQWGVELGKRLAVPIFAQLAGAPTDTQDDSTRLLVQHIRGAQTGGRSD